VVEVAVELDILAVLAVVMEHSLVSQMAVDKVVTVVQDLLEMVVTVEVLVKTVVMLRITKVEHEGLQETPLMDGVIDYQEKVLVMETAEVTQ
jgi:hypothetical protein